MLEGAAGRVFDLECTVIECSDSILSNALIDDEIILHTC